jgi:hypothetical protein
MVFFMKKLVNCGIKVKSRVKAPTMIKTELLDKFASAPV